MPTPQRTRHKIKPATTDMAVRLGLVVFVRGPLRDHAGALEDLWVRIQAGLLGRQLALYREASRLSWTPISDSPGSAGFAELFGMRGPVVGCWELELAEQGGDQDHSVVTSLQIADLAPVLDMERASYLRVLFAEDTPVSTVANLGEWAINHLPLWWGSAGFVFHHTSGSSYTAHKRMAALAKRFWGVQIQDMTALQWDALEGMPSVNWLSLVGDEFARFKGLTMENLVAEAANLTSAGLFQRKGVCGVAVAAGPKPLRGDINTGEDIGTYRLVARLIQPLLLTDHTPLSGPFATSEVLAAWLGRFAAPQAWLDCDIAAD